MRRPVFYHTTKIFPLIDRVLCVCYNRVGDTEDSYVESRGLNIYGSKLVKIPTPQYFVLYNGKDEAPAILELKLSDAFVKESPKGKFEWTATFINLNKGKMMSC